MIDHGQCTHPATKAGRAACRRKNAGAQSLVAELNIVTPGLTDEQRKLIDVRAMADKLMRDHGLVQDGWIFKWDRSKTRLGYCNWRRQVISLSLPFAQMNSIETMTKTMLHEIAHALTPYHNHDRVWRAKARELGISDQRCSTDHEASPQGKFKLTCLNCGYVIYRHRQTAKMYRLACRKCCNAYNNGKYDARFKLQVTQADWLK